MLSGATAFRPNSRAKSDGQHKISHIELELWLERSLRECARNAQRGSEERAIVFAEMLQKIATSDPVFGCFVDHALIDIVAQQDAAPPDVRVLQCPIVQERRLDALKRQTQGAEKENK
jgi:hypothetical protein